MSELNEIISINQIKSILKSSSGEKQLLELKFYLLPFKKELREIGVDPSDLAWNIYRTERNALK
jgi:hypothetical protein